MNDESFDKTNIPGGELQQAVSDSILMLGDRARDIKVLSELSDEEIWACSILDSYNQTHSHSALLTTLLSDFLYLRVSKNRKGRKEVGEAIKNLGKTMMAAFKSGSK